MTGKRKQSLKKIQKNPWMISTVVLAILVVVMSLGGFAPGAQVSGEEVGQKFVDYINAQGQAEIEFVSSEDFSPSLYQVTVNANGQEVPAHVTKDGKYFVQVVMPLDEEVQAPVEAQPAEPEVQEIVTAAVPHVELFIMSHCPFGTQAMKGMIPTVRELGDAIDFDLRFVNYAMHGESEVWEQANMYCIQEEQEDKLLDYLECFLGSEAGTEEQAAACLTEVGIDEAKLESCVEAADAEFDFTGSIANPNGRFPAFLADDALNVEYDVRGSPTLVVNGAQVSSGRSSQNYLDVICQSFDEVPEICGTIEVSAESPSPGFGWETTSSTGSAAQCG